MGPGGTGKTTLGENAVHYLSPVIVVPTKALGEEKVNSGCTLRQDQFPSLVYSAVARFRSYDDIYIYKRQCWKKNDHMLYNWGMCVVVQPDTEYSVSRGYGGLQ